MNRRRYLLSVLNMDMFRAVLFNNLYHDIIPNTIADRKARNNGKARLLKVEGNGAIENQLLEHGNFDVAWNVQYGTGSVSGNVMTFTANAQNGQAVALSPTFTKGHKYLSAIMVKATAPANSIVWFGGTQTYLALNKATTNWQQLIAIWEATDNNTYSYVLLRDLRASGWDAVQLKEAYIVDLTLECGTGNEPTDINDKRIKRIIEKYRPLNAGTYNSTIIESVETKGFNCWDEEWENGRLETMGGSSNVRTKNYIPILPSTTYFYKGTHTIYAFQYDENKDLIADSRLDVFALNTFTTSSKTRFIQFIIGADYGNTYNHDICINRSGERNGEYVPHRWQDFYQKVEYIENDAYNWLDTGFSPDQNTRVEFKARTSRSQTQGASPVFGARVGDSNESRFFPLAYDNVTRNRITFGNAEYVYDFTQNDIVEGKLDAKNKIGVINGSNINLQYNDFVKTANNNLLVFNTTGYPSYYYAKGRVYYCKIYDNNVLVRDFIPVYNKQDGTIGLYDLLNGKFYVNQGTGTFLKGADVPNDNVIKLPAPLQLDGAINSRNSFEITKNGYVFTRRVWNIDLGSVDWNEYTAGSKVFISPRPTNTKSNELNLFSIKYILNPIHQSTTNLEDKELYFGGSNINIKDISCADGTAFKNANKGVILYYGLETPQVITIPKKHLGAVDLGSANWRYFNGKMCADDIPMAIKSGITCFCSKYLSIPNIQNSAVSMPEKTICGVDDGTQLRVYVTDSSFNGDATAFKNAMKGVYLFYETQDEVEDFLDEGLPKEYQRVDYIENNGNAMIDTGYYGNKETKIEMSFRLVQASTNDTFANVGYGGNYIQPNLSTTGTPRTSRFGDKSFSVGYGISSSVINNINLIEIDKTGVKLNKVVVGEELSNVTAFTTPETLTIGIMRNINTDYCNGVIRYYYCKFYDNGSLVRDFVPCYRKADGVAGLYDRVTKRFFTNAGTGTFAKGNDVYENVNEELYQRGGEINGYKPTLPSEYERVEYLQSSGSQWIDTGVTGDNDIGFNIDVSAINGNDQVWLGIQTFFQLGSNGGVDYTGVYYGWNGINTLQYARPTINFGDKHNYKHNFMNSREALFDNVENANYVLNYSTITATTRNVCLFARNKSTGSGVDTEFMSYIKVYMFQISKGDKLVRDFIPAVRKSDNVAGLYDMVTRQFFTNQGTGTFAVGGYVERPHETCEVLPNVEVSLQCK